jgi:hypothetical protein
MFRRHRSGSRSLSEDQITSRIAATPMGQVFEELEAELQSWGSELCEDPIRVHCFQLRLVLDKSKCSQLRRLLIS